MKRGMLVCLGLLVGATLLTRPCIAQDRAGDVVARAQALQQAGSWTDARALLTDELTHCAAGAEGRGCRGLLLSALGYMYQRQAETDTTLASDLLTRAAEYYRRALGESPQDGASLTNLALVYRALDRHEELQQVVDSALIADPDHASLYALMLGESYEARGQWGPAAALYRRAIAIAPDDESLRRRLVEAYRRLPADSVKNLLRLVFGRSDWETGTPDATARAYELGVSTLARRDRDTARRVCMRWIGILSETQLLSAERLDAVGESWITPALAELKVLFEDPRRPPRDRFWQDSIGREAVGRVALALGRRHAAAGDASAADAYWRTGMDIAQAYPATAVTVELATEAAGLYQRNRDLDPGDLKFHRIEAQLFEEKSEAYRRGDRDAIQQLHTILGLIYAERRIWTSNTPWTNATYQLEHALSTARQRDSASGSYQPLPQLRVRLAQAYAANGRGRDAAATYLTAAQAYLDADDPGSAGTMLQRSQAIGGVTPTRTIGFVAELIRARLNGAASLTSLTRLTLDECEETARRATEPGVVAGIDTTFLKRQQFKLLADCVVTGPAPVRPPDAARVFNFVATQNVPLVGAGDLVRLERSQTAVNRVLRSSAESSSPFAEIPASRRAAPFRVQLASESRPRYLPVSTDALVGAKVIEQLRTDTAVRAVRVREGRVTVLTSDVSVAEKDRIEHKTQDVGGVESVHVRPRAFFVVPIQPPNNPAVPPAAPPAPALQPGVQPALQAAVQPALQPALQPAQPALPPAPPPVPAAALQPGAAQAMLGLLADPKAAFTMAIAAYARALESRRLEAVRRVVPEFDTLAVKTLFARSEQLQAKIGMRTFSVEGDRGTAVIAGQLEYRVSGVVRRQAIQQKATFVRDSSGTWRLTSIR